MSRVRSTYVANVASVGHRCQREAEARIGGEPAPVRQLAGFLDQHAIGGRRREIRHEARRGVGVTRRREDRRCCADRRRRNGRSGFAAVGCRNRRDVVAQAGDLELVQLLHEPRADDLHRHRSIDERITT